MFELNEKNKVNGNNLKCDQIRYSLSGISTINTANSPTYINIPRDCSVISLIISYNDLNFDVLYAAASNRYVDRHGINLVNLDTNAFFCSSKITSSRSI